MFAELITKLPLTTKLTPDFFPPFDICLIALYQATVWQDLADYSPYFIVFILLLLTSETL